MLLTISRFTLHALLLWAGLTGLATPTLVAAQDNYLREIEEEANRQATTLTTSQAQSLPSLAPPLPVTNAEDRLTAGLDRPSFEQALNKSLSKETGGLFKKLNPQDQQRVYESYQSDSRLTAISESINRLANP
jgi:hypothetical protein